MKIRQYSEDYLKFRFTFLRFMSTVLIKRINEKKSSGNPFNDDTWELYQLRFKVLPKFKDKFWKKTNAKISFYRIYYKY